MELKLQNGAYVPGTRAGLATVSGTEEAAQRILMKLTARRGGFAPLPEYGSRLYTLCREKPAQREAAAVRWIREALADESGVTLESVTVTEPEPGVLALDLALALDGEALDLNLTI